MTAIVDSTDLLRPARSAAARRSFTGPAARSVFRRGVAWALLLFTALIHAVTTASAGEARRHAIAMHGTPALPSDFSHLPHVRADAPKGGNLVLGQLGTFDSLNPYIVKGVAVIGVREHVYESLLARAPDEPFTLYGLIARGVEMPDDRRWIAFHLDPDARFSDGRPITAEDVLFSWSLLKDRGQPYHRAHYRNVEKAEIPAPGVIRFTFLDNGNREAPLLLGLMPVLPRHRWTPESFERTTFEPPVGSGPYVVAKVDPGRSVNYQRNPDWWGLHKPINRGRHNFESIRYDHYRDQTTLFEAFKSGDVHLRAEDDAGRWAEGYDFAAARDGRVVKAEIETGLPAGMTGLALNTRRPVLADPRVRRALIHLLDFEFINRSLYHGRYARTQSYFERSELSSVGHAADPRERALLAPILSRLGPDILAGTHRFPVTDGTGNDRRGLRAASVLLKEAGYVQDGARIVHATSRKPLTLELMAATRTEERLFQAYARNLERLGIDTSIRLVDSSQRWARLKTFDFDVVQWTWVASLSPGNEQMNRWSVESAGIELSLNYPGVREPVANTLIEALLQARERPELISAARALDRMLLAGDYVVPLFHPRKQWIAHWAFVRTADRPPLFGFTLDSWWMEPR